MGKLATYLRSGHLAQERKQLVRLRTQRRKLQGQLHKIEDRIAKFGLAGSGHSSSDLAFNRWLDELSEGLPNLPSLPADFSRCDLYDDHD